MKKLPCFLTLILPLAVTAFCSAQAETPAEGREGGRGHGGRGPGGRHSGPGHPLVRVLDTDHDGEISSAELANASASLRTLDANSDGSLTLDELRPARPERPADAATPPADRPARGGGRGGQPRPVAPMMLALDADQNETLSPAEIANASASLKALDLNGDGKLTPDEFRLLPPEGSGHRDGQGPRQD